MATSMFSARRLWGQVSIALLFPLAVLAGTDIQVNSDVAGSVQNESRIVRNATDSLNLVVAYNDSIGAATSPLGISFSLDGGATWADRQLSVPVHPTLGTPDDGLAMDFIFDPYLDSDSTGNLYAGYIAARGGPGGPSGLYLERSTDKGQTWSGPTTIAFDVRTPLPPPPPPPPGPYRFNDRPDMTVDGSDNLYVVWIKDVGQGQPTSDIYFAKSPPPGTPGPGNPTGLDFTGTSGSSVAPQTVNDGANGTDYANVPDVEVASNGTVYVAWIDVDVTNPASKPARLMLDRSFDGGVTFGTDQLVANITALASTLSTTAGLPDARSGSYPALAVDPSNAQILYVSYAADPAGSDEADIYFIKSTDGGATWSAPLLVNDDGTTRDQFHPAIAVKANRIIDLVWYDKRLSAQDDGWDVYFAASSDAGTSFSPNLRVTDQTFATPTDLWGSPWMGEYLDVEVSALDADITFTSSVADATGDPFYDLVPNVADLLVTKSESIDPVLAGSGAGNLTYVVGVKNLGPLNATGVTLNETMTLPTGVSLVSATPSTGSFAGSTWTLGSLSAGASATLTVALTVSTAASTGTDTIGNTAAVATVNEPDPNSSNDSMTVATSVTGVANLIFADGFVSGDTSAWSTTQP
jgi:uncharacterized repeat protein (TIGR01451 family)